MAGIVVQTLCWIIFQVFFECRVNYFKMSHSIGRWRVRLQLPSNLWLVSNYCCCESVSFCRFSIFWQLSIGRKPVDDLAVWNRGKFLFYFEGKRIKHTHRYFYSKLKWKLENCTKNIHVKSSITFAKYCQRFVFSEEANSVVSTGTELQCALQW